MLVRIVQKFCSLGLKRLGALAVLSVVAVPAVFGVCIRHWPATRKSVAAVAMIDPAADLAPTVNFSAAEVAAASAAPAEDDSAVRERQLYPYSIIPGGISSAAELRSAEHDDNIRGHYAGLNIENAHIARLTEAKFVYVSYRRGSKIFWTKNAVRLPKGERVITDGEVTLRARCGNRISETPMGPVEGQGAAVPPEAMELPPADVAAVPLPPIGPGDVPMVPPTETAMLIPPGDTTPGAPAPYVPPGFWIPPGGGPRTSGSTTPPSGPGGPSGPGTPPSGPGSPSGPGTPPSGPGTPPSGPGSPPSGPGTPPSGPGAPPSGPGTPPSGPGSPPISTPEPAELAMLAAGVGSVVVAGLRRKHSA